MYRSIEELEVTQENLDELEFSGHINRSLKLTYQKAVNLLHARDRLLACGEKELADYVSCKAFTFLPDKVVEILLTLLNEDDENPWTADFYYEQCDYCNQQKLLWSVETEGAHLLELAGIELQEEEDIH